MPTTVMSVRGLDRATLLTDPLFVYIGRCCAGWPASVWGNPFKPELVYIGERPRMTPAMREVALRQCLARYHGWLLSRPELVARLPELRGKRLGCWCGSYPQNPDLLCHGVVLAKLADGPEV